MRSPRRCSPKVYAPDIRGHGKTGHHGDIDYPGQLDDDLADLVGVVRARHQQARIVLLGLSSGGGFALHAAAALGSLIDRTILLAPMLGGRAPTGPQFDDGIGLAAGGVGLGHEAA